MRPALIRSAASAAALSHALARANAFTIEAEIAPADLVQTGPARIVSISADPYARNLTLAQEAADVVLRVRTPTNGPDGSGVELQTTCGPLRPSWCFVVAVHECGTERIYLDGVPVTPPLRLYDLSAMLFQRPSPISTFLLGLAAFATVGAAAALRLSRRRPYLVWIAGGGATLAAPILTAVAMAAYLQREQDVAFLLAGVCGTCAGVWLGARQRRETRRRPGLRRRAGECAPSAAA